MFCIYTWSKLILNLNAGIFVFYAEHEHKTKWVICEGRCIEEKYNSINLSGDWQLVGFFFTIYVAVGQLPPSYINNKKKRDLDPYMKYTLNSLMYLSCVYLTVALIVDSR